jgi:hypothetical protein
MRKKIPDFYALRIHKVRVTDVQIF